MKSKNTVLCIMAIILFINFLTFEKRSSSVEFTQSEKFRLYELEKELRESH